MPTPLSACGASIFAPSALTHAPPLLGSLATGLYKRGLCSHAVSVRLSVCLSHSWTLSKRINIPVSSIFSHRWVATRSSLFHTKSYNNIPTGTPITGALNTGGVGENSDYQPISGSIACCERFDCQVQYTQLRRTIAS